MKSKSSNEKTSKIIKTKWVSELIRTEYKNWNKEKIILDCGTGTGKTHFCINVLGKYAKSNNKKIIYLCNRSKLKNQVFDAVKNKGLQKTIYVTTYQNLQNKIKNKKSIEKYDYIIADECHYFVTDASFNDATDIALSWINQQKESVIMFVSATAKTFFQALLRKNYVKEHNYYHIDKDYSYVKKLYYYKKDELASIIDDILANEKESKIVVFCNSAQRLIDMSKIYQSNADYYCAKNTHNERLKEICGWLDAKGKVKECNDVIVNHNPELVTFEKRILFTTKVLDNGVDLKDEKIKHIFTEIVDVDTMIQALGRKRSLNANDTCTFYIRDYTKSGIQGFINRTKYQLDPVELYKENYNEFYKNFGHRNKRIKDNPIFYEYFPHKKNQRCTNTKEIEKDSSIRINVCRYRKAKQDMEMFEGMKECGYKEYLATIFPEQLNQLSEDMVIGVEEIDLFLQYLKSIEGKRLYADDQKIVKEEFENIGVTLRYKGINTFNGALQDVYGDLYECRFYNKDADGKNYKDYKRKLDNGFENPNYKKNYWMLEPKR